MKQRVAKGLLTAGSDKSDEAGDPLVLAREDDAKGRDAADEEPEEVLAARGSSAASLESPDDPRAPAGFAPIITASIADAAGVTVIPRPPADPRGGRVRLREAGQQLLDAVSSVVAGVGGGNSAASAPVDDSASGASPAGDGTGGAPSPSIAGDGAPPIAAAASLARGFTSILKKGTSAVGRSAAAALAAANAAGESTVTSARGGFPRPPATAAATPASLHHLHREGSDGRIVALQREGSDGKLSSEPALDRADSELAAADYSDDDESTSSQEEGASAVSVVVPRPSPLLRREASTTGIAVASAALPAATAIVSASGAVAVSPFGARGRLLARQGTAPPATSRRRSVPVVAPSTPAATQELARLAGSLTALLQLPSLELDASAAAVPLVGDGTSVASAPSTAPPSPTHAAMLAPSSDDASSGSVVADSEEAPFTSSLLSRLGARSPPMGATSGGGIASALRRGGLQLARVLTDGSAGTTAASSSRGRAGTAAGSAHAYTSPPSAAASSAHVPEVALGRHGLLAALAAADLASSTAALGDASAPVGKAAVVVAVTVTRRPTLPALAPDTPVPAVSSQQPLSVLTCLWPPASHTLSLFAHAGRGIAWGTAALASTHAGLAPRLAAWVAEFRPAPASSSGGGGKSAAGPAPISVTAAQPRHAVEASLLLHLHAALCLAAPAPAGASAAGGYPRAVHSGGAWRGNPAAAAAFVEAFGPLLQPDTCVAIAAVASASDPVQLGPAATALITGVLAHGANARNPRFGAPAAATLHRGLNIAAAQSDGLAAVRVTPLPEAWGHGGSDGGSGGGGGASGGDALAATAFGSTTPASAYAACVGADDEDGVWLPPELPLADSEAGPPLRPASGGEDDGRAPACCDVAAQALVAWDGGAPPKRRLSKRCLWAALAAHALLERAPLQALMPVTPATLHEPPRPLPLPQLAVTLHHWGFLLQAVPVHAGRTVASLVARRVLPVGYGLHVLLKLPRAGGGGATPAAAEPGSEPPPPAPVLLSGYAGPAREGGRVALALLAQYGPAACRLDAHAAACLLELALAHKPPQPSLLWASAGVPRAQPRGTWGAPCERSCDLLLARLGSAAETRDRDAAALQRVCWSHGYMRGVWQCAASAGASDLAAMAQRLVLAVHGGLEPAQLTDALARLPALLERAPSEQEAVALLASVLRLAAEAATAQAEVAGAADAPSAAAGALARVVAASLVAAPSHTAIAAVASLLGGDARSAAPLPELPLPAHMCRTRRDLAPAELRELLSAALPADFTWAAAALAATQASVGAASMAIAVSLGRTLWRESLARHAESGSTRRSCAAPAAFAAFSLAGAAAAGGLVDPVELRHTVSSALLPSPAVRQREDAARGRVPPRDAVTVQSSALLALA